MKTSRTSASKFLSDTLDAARLEPVIVTHYGEDDVVIVSAVHWEAGREAILDAYAREDEAIHDHWVEVRAGLSVS